VSGNHDEYEYTQQIFQAIESAGIQIINDKNVVLKGINFLGVPYHTTETEEGLEKSLRSIDFDKKLPSILLRHKPTLHSVIEKFHIDLVVSGHTHYGQMFPFSLIAKSVYGKFVYGKTQYHDLISITSSGVGNWGPPQSIGTISEIVLIHID